MHCQSETKNCQPRRTDTLEKKKKKHLKNLLGMSPQVTNEPIMKIINNQLDIKLGQFTQEELDVVLSKN